MEKQLKEEILETLPHFNGTEQLWEHRTFAGSIFLSGGCNFIREKAQCRWLFDLIFSHQLKLKTESFQCWKLNRVDGNSFSVQCSDGNKTILVSQVISYSDFPLDEIEIWMIDSVCLLPSEN